MRTALRVSHRITAPGPHLVPATRSGNNGRPSKVSRSSLTIRRRSLVVTASIWSNSAAIRIRNRAVP